MEKPNGRSTAGRPPRDPLQLLNYYLDQADSIKRELETIKRGPTNNILALAIEPEVFFTLLGMLQPGMLSAGDGRFKKIGVFFVALGKRWFADHGATKVCEALNVGFPDISALPEMPPVAGEVPDATQ